MRPLLLESGLLLRDVTHKLDIGITRIKVLDEVVQAFSVSRPDAEAVISEMLPNERCYWVCVHKVFFKFVHKDIGILCTIFVLMLVPAIWG